MPLAVDGVFQAEVDMTLCPIAPAHPTHRGFMSLGFPTLEIGHEK